VAIAIPFVAALVLLGGYFAVATHSQFSSQRGRITAVMVWSDQPGCLQMSLDLDNGKYVSIDDCGAGPDYVLNPRPAPGDFAAGDQVTATNYAGSATDLVLDHNGTKMHYTSAYYKSIGVSSASQQQTISGLLMTAAVVSIGLCVLIALGRSLWLARALGPAVGAASFVTVTTLAPYLGFAALGGTAGGISVTNSPVYGLLIATTIVGLVSAASFWVIYSAARGSALSEGASAELKRLRTIAAVAAAGWLLAGAGLTVTLALLGASCCG
jgi:hypothetical protein